MSAESAALVSRLRAQQLALQSKIDALLPPAPPASQASQASSDQGSARSNLARAVSGLGEVMDKEGVEDAIAALRVYRCGCRPWLEMSRGEGARLHGKLGDGRDASPSMSAWAALCCGLVSSQARLRDPCIFACVCARKTGSPMAPSTHRLA